MLNLDQAIAKWRQQMLAAGIKTPELLDELESHLRDDVEDQMRAGVNAQHALEAAVRRIGESAALKVEFKKAASAGGTRVRILVLAFSVLGLLVWLTVANRATAIQLVTNELQALCLALGLLLSLVLPVMASLHPGEAGKDLASVRRTVWTGQLLIGVGGSLSIAVRLHPGIGLTVAAIICAVFARKLRRELPAILVASNL